MRVSKLLPVHFRIEFKVVFISSYVSGLLSPCQPLQTLRFSRAGHLITLKVKKKTHRRRYSVIMVPGYGTACQRASETET